MFLWIWIAMHLRLDVAVKVWFFGYFGDLVFVMLLDYLFCCHSKTIGNAGKKTEIFKDKNSIVIIVYFFRTMSDVITPDYLGRRLFNTANLCYLNSAVQAILSSKAFREHLDPVSIMCSFVIIDQQLISSFYLGKSYPL